MRTFKVNKGIQKEIRYLGLKSDYALQYLLSLALFYSLCFTLLGMTKQTLFIYIIAVFIIYLPFKRKDKMNRKYDINKRKANEMKPKQIIRYSKIG